MNSVCKSASAAVCFLDNQVSFDLQIQVLAKEDFTEYSIFTFAKIKILPVIHYLS